ncbi:hypothetical protein HanRHA438_Chr16g0743631 [Helianthus annuus]|nr:hypothetical protein HanRHA438_Chr16g0743631 [Helianthus annuus]
MSRGRTKKAMLRRLIQRAARSISIFVNERRTKKAMLRRLIQRAARSISIFVNIRSVLIIPTPMSRERRTKKAMLQRLIQRIILLLRASIFIFLNTISSFLIFASRPFTNSNLFNLLFFLLCV